MKINKLYNSIVLLFIVLIGTFSFLDGLSSSIDFITFPIALGGTLSIVILVLLAQYYLRRNKITWQANSGSPMRLKKIGKKIYLTLLAIIIGLWIPLFLKKVSPSDVFIDDRFVESTADGLVRGFLFDDLKANRNDKIKFYFTSKDIDDPVFIDLHLSDNKEICFFSIPGDEYCPFSVVIDGNKNFQLNLMIKDTEGNVLLEINKNKAIINKKNLYTISCNDREFEVKDNNNNLICQFRYLGNNEFIFRGLLSFNERWIVFTDDYMYIAKDRTDSELYRSLSDNLPRLDASLDWCR
ncbi:hypothetical protein [uncultured Aquimarina sp.]|uniref:hypothetical protein n=1 Tax=uncultured Aquimarina sp. TaxID=575652 RepID=UPI0026154370|nr:hypothetical protein [uncultured Aquimarina sp.]